VVTNCRNWHAGRHWIYHVDIYHAVSLSDFASITQSKIAILIASVASGFLGSIVEAGIAKTKQLQYILT
jgi:hypothetical protein